MKDKHLQPSLSENGPLDGKQAAHLPTCPACRADSALYERILQGNARTLDPQREMQMREALQQRISETAIRRDARKRPARRALLRPVPLLGFSAACLVAVVLLILVPPPTDTGIRFETATPGIIASPYKENRADLPFRVENTDDSKIVFSTETGMDFRFDGPGAFSLDRKKKDGGFILELHGGQALVAVRSGASGPLEVRVPDASIRVVGTEFSVFVRDTATVVALFRGKLNVERQGKTESLQAGQAARIDGTGITVANEWQTLLGEPERARCASFFSNFPATPIPESATRPQSPEATVKKRQYQRILLADGNTLEGLLVSQDETTIVLLSGSAKYFIERSNIRRISYFTK